MSGKYQAYPDYKATGIDWLPAVPVEWQVLPLKLASANKVKDGPHETPKFLDEGIPFFSVDGIQDCKLVFEGCRYISPEDHKRFSMKCLPKFGDVLLGKAASVGKVAFVDTKEEFNVWSPLAVLTPKSVKLGRFIFYSLQSTWLQAQCDVNSNSNTQKNLSMGVIDNLSFAIPSDDVAEKIANFLDHETAKIDTLIEKQQQLIALLKEKCQAVISHAVTKGLNANAPMRDSGVEWLGEVPEHWDVMPLKYAITFQRGHDLPAQHRIAGDVPLVSSAGISSSHNIASAKSPGLVTGRYGTIGKFYLIEEDYWPLNTTLFSINLRGNKPKYLWYMLHNLQPIFIANSLKSAVPGVDRNDLHTVKVAITKNHDEQDALCDYLDDINQRYDAVTAKAAEQVQLLQERRTALISAAVTGKVDVRNWDATNG